MLSRACILSKLADRDGGEESSGLHLARALAREVDSLKRQSFRKCAWLGQGRGNIAVMATRAKTRASFVMVPLVPMGATIDA